MNLSGEKDLGLKTSDLGLTSDAGLRLAAEADAGLLTRGFGGLAKRALDFG